MAPIGQKKKTHKGLWITLIVIFVVIILPIGAFFGLFYDSSVKDLSNVPKTDLDKIMTNAVVDLFDDTKTEKHEMNLKISENNLNGVINSTLTTQLPSEVQPYLTQAYLEIDEQNKTYYFVIALNAFNVFKTRAIIKAELAEGDASSPGLIFKITDIQLGRLGGLRDLGHNIIKNFFNDQKLADIFAKAGLHIEPHLDEHYIYYSTSNFINDVVGKIGSGGKMALFTSMFKEMVEGDKFQYDFYTGKQIKAALSLLEFHTNPNYCSPEYTIDEATLNLDQCISDYMLPMMDDGTFDDATGALIENDAKAALEFFMMGANNIEENAKLILFPKYTKALTEQLKSKGINSIEEYTTKREALFGPKGTPVNELMSGRVASEILKTGGTIPEKVNYFVNGGTISVNMYENEIHDVIKTSNPVGFNYLFHRTADSGVGYKLNYMVIDNFYFNIVEGNMYVVFGVNLNGYETSLILTSKAQAGESGTELVFPVSSDNVYFGTYKCSEDMFKAFLDIMDDAFKGGASWFKLKDKKVFIIDFAEALRECGELSAIETAAKTMGYSKSVTVEAKNEKGLDISGLGYLKLSLGFKKD